MRYILFFVLLAHAPLVSASDPTGLLYFFLGQFVISVWPLILPLPFLKGITKKTRSYFILILVTYGVLGVLNIPWNWFVQLSPWMSANVSQWLPIYIVVHHAVAFAVSIWVLAAFRRHLMSLSAASSGA